MPRKRTANRHPKVPALRPHSSGRARVTLSGQTFYCGPEGSAEAHARYAELVQQWEANGRSWAERGPQTVADVQAIAERIARQHDIPLPAAERVADVLAEFAGKLTAPEAIALAQARHPALFARAPEAPPLTIAQAFAQYEEWIDATGRYMKGGKRSTERAIVAKAVAEFTASYGDRPIGRLDAATLLAHRDRLCARKARKAQEAPPVTVEQGVTSVGTRCAESAECAERPLGRRGVNRKVTTLQRGVRWLKARRIVSRDQAADLLDVPPLRAGEMGDAGEARRTKRAPTAEEVDRVAKAAGTVIGAMLKVMLACGCRPGEVARMTWADIWKDGPDGCWVYTVPGAKAAYHHETVYLLPPSVQAILKGFPAFPKSPIFAVSQHVEERRLARRAARKSEVQPSQQERDQRRSRRYRVAFTTDVLGAIVKRACIKAGVAPFSPHSCRHAFISAAARKYGVMAASVAANHTSVAVTECYLHRDESDRSRVVLGLERDGKSPDPGTDSAVRVG